MTWSDCSNIEGRDPYVVLELDPRQATTYSATVIQRAYRQMSRKTHPDKNPSKSANQDFLKVTDANTILSNDIRRREIDHTIELRFACWKRYNSNPNAQQTAYSNYVKAQGKDVIVETLLVNAMNEQDQASTSTRTRNKFSAASSSSSSNGNTTNNNGSGRQAPR